MPLDNTISLDDLREGSIREINHTERQNPREVKHETDLLTSLVYVRVLALLSEDDQKTLEEALAEVRESIPNEEGVIAEARRELEAKLSQFKNYGRDNILAAFSRPEESQVSRETYQDFIKASKKRLDGRVYDGSSLDRAKSRGLDAVIVDHVRENPTRTANGWLV